MVQNDERKNDFFAVAERNVCKIAGPQRPRTLLPCSPPRPRYFLVRITSKTSTAERRAAMAAVVRADPTLRDAYLRLVWWFPFVLAGIGQLPAVFYSSGHACYAAFSLPSARLSLARATRPVHENDAETPGTETLLPTERSSLSDYLPGAVTFQVIRRFWQNL